MAPRLRSSNTTAARSEISKYQDALGRVNAYEFPAKEGALVEFVKILERLFILPDETMEYDQEGRRCSSLSYLRQMVAHMYVNRPNDEVRLEAVLHGFRHSLATDMLTPKITGPFRILELPIEVRLMIFEYALGGHRINIITNPLPPSNCRRGQLDSFPPFIQDIMDAHTGKRMIQLRTKKMNRPRIKRPSPDYGALRLVCKQFHDEAIGFDRYKHNVFFFRLNHHLSNWIKFHPSSLRTVQNIRVVQTGWPSRASSMMFFKVMMPNLKIVEMECQHWTPSKDSHGKLFDGIVRFVDEKGISSSIVEAPTVEEGKERVKLVLFLCKPCHQKEVRAVKS